MFMKEYANIGMAALSRVINIKTPHGRAAANRHTVRDDSGLHLLQIPVRLYILLHFYAESNTGHAAFVPEDLARKLRCNVKSVRAALSKLRENGFISFTEDGFETTDITISEISNMYRKSGDGGKGYITCGPELRDSLLGTRRINDLRVILRSLIQTVSAEITGASKKAEARISMNDLRAGLPGYVKPCVVRAVLEQQTFNNVFDPLRIGRKDLLLRLRSEVNGKTTKARIRSQATDSVRTEFDVIKRTLAQANTTIHEKGYILPSDIIELSHHGVDLIDAGLQWTDKPLPAIDYNRETIDSCATLAQDFGIDAVISAVQTACRNIICGKISKNQNLGGIIRNIIQEMVSFSPAAAV